MNSFYVYFWKQLWACSKNYSLRIPTAYNTICGKCFSRRIQVVGFRFIFFLTRNDLDVSIIFPQRKNVWMTGSTDQWVWNTWNHQRFILKQSEIHIGWNSTVRFKLYSYGFQNIFFKIHKNKVWIQPMWIVVAETYLRLWRHLRVNRGSFMDLTFKVSMFIRVNWNKGFEWNKSILEILVSPGMK